MLSRALHNDDARFAAAAVACAGVFGLGVAGGGYRAQWWGVATLLLASILLASLFRTGRFALGPALLAVGLLVLTAFDLASLSWTQSVTLTVPEVERDLLYATVAVAASIGWTIRRAEGLLLGVIAAGTALVALALAENFVLHRPIDPFEGVLLRGDVGYANALGVLAVMCAIAAAATAADTESRLLAGIAHFLACSAVLTGSLGAAAAAVVGMLVALAVSPVRSRLFVVLGSAATCAAVLSVAVASSHVLDDERTGALVRWEARGVALACVLAGVLGTTSVRLRAPSFLRPATASLVAGAAVAAVVAIVAAGQHGDRSRYWHVARSVFADAPLLGHGAGTFERDWQLRRTVDREVRDAHSLFVESAAERGVVGTILLVAALGLPIASAFRVRVRVPAAALGAYTAFLVHAGIDWDWEMPVVTVPGVLFATVILAAASGTRVIERRTQRIAAGVVVATAAGTAFLLAGNWQLQRSRDALVEGRTSAAVMSARRTARLQPWSGEPALLQAQALLQLGARADAVKQLRRSIDHDSANWQSWWLLSIVSSDELERSFARARAAALNPLSPGLGRVGSQK